MLFQMCECGFSKRCRQLVVRLTNSEDKLSTTLGIINEPTFDRLPRHREAISGYQRRISGGFRPNSILGKGGQEN